MARLFRNISDVSTDIAVRRHKTLIGEEAYNALAKAIRDATQKDWTTKFVLNRLANAFVWEESTARPLTSGEQYKIYVGSLDFSKAEAAMTRKIRYGGKTEQEKEAASRARQMIYIGQFANISNAILVPSDKGAQFVRIVRVEPSEQGGRGREIPLSPQEALSVLGIEIAKPGEAKTYKRLRRLISGTADVEVDVSGARIVSWNPQLEQKTGITPAKADGIFYVTQELMNSIASQYEASDPALANRIRNLRRFAGSVFTEEGLAKGHVIVLPEGYKGFGPGDIFIPEYKGEIKSTQRRLFSFQIFGVRGDEAEVDKLSFMNAAYYITEPTKRVSTIIESAVRGSRALFDPNRIQSRVLERVERIISLNENNRWDINLMALGGVSPLFTQYGARTTLHEHLPLPFFMEESQRKDITSGRYKLDLENVFSLELTNAAVFVHKNKRFEEFIRNLPKGYAYADVATGSLYISAHDYPETAARLGGGDQDDRLLIYANPSGQAIIQRQPSDFGEFETFKIINAPQLRRMGFIKPDTQYQIMRLQMNAINPIFKEFEVDELGSYDEAYIINRVLAGLNVNWQSPHGRDLLNLFYALEKEGRLGAYVNSIMAVSAAMGRGITRPMVRMEELIDSTVKDLSKDTIRAQSFIDFIQGEDGGIAPALAAVSYVAAGKLKGELFQRNQRARAQIPPNLWGLSKIDVLYKVNQIALDYINLIGSDPERSARSRMIVPRADIYSAPARWYELIPYKRETGEDRSFFFADYNAIFNKVSGWFRTDYQSEMMGGYSNGPSIPRDVMQSMQGFQAAILSEAKQRDRQDVISRYSDIDFNEKFETINVLFAKKVFDAINAYLEKNNRQKITPYQFVTGEFEMDENIAKGIAAHLLYPYSNPEDWKLSNEMFFNKYMTNVMLRALEAAGLSKPGMTLDEIKQSFAEKGTFTFYVFKGGEEDLSRFVGGTATLFYKTGAGGVTSVNLKLSKQLESGETIEKEVTLPMDIASPIWDIKGGKVVFAKGKTQTAPFAAITIEPEYKTQEDYLKWELLDTDPFEAVKQYAQNPVEITQQYLYHLSPQDMIKFNVAKEIMSRGKEVRGLFKEYKPISDWLSDPLGSPFPQEEVERAVQSGLITREEAAELEKFKNILPKLAPYFEPTSGRIYGRLAITTPQELSDPNSQTSISVRQLLEQQRQQSKADIRIKEINTYASILNGEVSVEEGVIQLAREYGLTVNVFYSETFKRNKRKSYEGVTVNYIQVPDAKAINTSRALIASAHIIAGSRIPVINKTAAEVTDTEQLREQLAQNPDFENVYGVLLPYTTQSQQPQMVTIHEVQDAPYTINFADAPISTTIFDLERKRAEAVRNVIAPSRKLPWEERAPSSRVQARATVQAQTQTTARTQTSAQAPAQQAAAPTQQRQQAVAPTQQQQQTTAPTQQQQTRPQQPAQNRTATDRPGRANPLEGRMYALTPENIGTIQETLNWALENAEQTRRSMMERGTLSEDMQAAFEEVTGGYRSALEAMRSGRPLASKNLEYVQRALQKRFENLRASGASREDIRNMEKLIGTVSEMLTNVRKEEGRAAQQAATQAQATQAQSQQAAQSQAVQAQSQQTTGRRVSEAQQTYQRTGTGQQRGSIAGFNEIVSALEFAMQRAAGKKEAMQREGKLTPNMLLTFEEYYRGYQSALQTIRSNQPFTQEQLTYVTQAITRKIEDLQSSGAPSSEIEKYQALLNTMNILRGGSDAGIREASQQSGRQQTQGGGGGQEPPEPPSTVSAVPAPEEPSQPQPSANRGLTRNEIKLMEETLGYAIQRANRLRAEALKNRNADRQKIQSQYQERVGQYSAAINAIKRGAALTPENVNAMILATQYRLADLRSQQNPQRPNQRIGQQIQALQGVLGILENMSRAMQSAQESQSEEDFDINDIEQPIPENYRAQSESANATGGQAESIQEQQNAEENQRVEAQNSEQAAPIDSRSRSKARETTAKSKDLYLRKSDYTFLEGLLSERIAKIEEEFVPLEYNTELYSSSELTERYERLYSQLADYTKVLSRVQSGEKVDERMARVISDFLTEYRKQYAIEAQSALEAGKESKRKRLQSKINRIDTILEQIRNRPGIPTQLELGQQAEDITEVQAARDNISQPIEQGAGDIAFDESQPIDEEPQLEAVSEELANQVAISADIQANAESQPMTLGGEDALEPRVAIDQYIEAIAYAVGQEANEAADQIQTILQAGNVSPIEKANSIGRFELEINKLNRIIQDIQSGRGLTSGQLEKLSKIIRKHSGIAISQLAEVEDKEAFASNVVGPLMMSESYIAQKQHEVSKASEKLRLTKTAELLDAIFTFGTSGEASSQQAGRRARIDQVLRELISEANYVHPLAIRKIAENINFFEEQFELAKDNLGAFAGKSKAELDYLRDLAYSYENNQYASRDRRAFLYQIIFDAYMEGNYEGRGRGSSHFRAEDIIYSLLPESTLQSDIDIASHVASAIFEQRDRLSESDYAATVGLVKKVLTSGIENLDVESASSIVGILQEYLRNVDASEVGDFAEVISVNEGINILNRHIGRRQEAAVQTQEQPSREEIVPESIASATEIAAQSDVAAQSAEGIEPRSIDERFRLLSFFTDDLVSISLSVLKDEIRESEIYLEELENNPLFSDSDDLQNEHAIYSRLVEDYRSALEAIRERDKPIETKTVNLLMQALTNWRARWDRKLSEARRAGDEIGVILAREKIARADTVLSHINTNYQDSQLIPASAEEYDERSRLLSGFDEDDYKAAAGILRREIEEKEARLVSLEEDVVSESSSELQEEYERLSSEVEDYRLALHEIESGGPISTDSVRAIERAASRQKTEAAYEYSMFANAGNEQGKEEARRKRYETTRILSRIEAKRYEFGDFDDEEVDEVVSPEQQPEVVASEQQPEVIASEQRPEAIEASSESTARMQAASEEAVAAAPEPVAQEQQAESVAQASAEPTETVEQQTPTQQQESSGAGTPGQPRRILFGANRNPRFSTADEELVNYSVDQLLRWPDQFDVYFDTSDFATGMIRKLAEQKQAGNQAAASLLERAKVIVTAKSFETEMGQRALEAISEAGITSDQFVTADLFRVEREGQEESFESIAEIMRTASDEGVRDFVISTGANDPDTVLSILVHRFGKNQSLPVGTPEEERQAFEGLSAGIYISAQMAASQGGAVNLTLGTNERGPVRVRIKPEEQITNADGTPRVDRRGLPMFRFTVEVFRQDRRGRQYSEAIVRTGRVADAGQQYVRRRGERVAARATAEGAAQSQQTARGGARAQEIVQRAEYAPANLAEEAIEDIRQLPIPERMGAFYSHLSQDAEQQQFNTGRSGRTPTAEQREYITRIMSGVAEGRRMIASLHTGWGKTSIIGAITSMGQERAAAQAGVRSRLNIVITPNTALSEELTKVLREQYGVNAIKHVADPGLRSELIPDWEERNRQYQAYRRQVFASLNQMVWQNKDLTLVMTPEAFSNFSKSQVGRFSIWSMLDRGVNVIIDEAQEITRETGRPFHLIREGIENIEAEFARVSSEAKVGVALVGGTMTDPVLDAISQFFGVNEEDILKKRLPLSYLSKRIEPLKESETISNRVLHRVRTAFEEGKDSILVFGGRIQDIHDITNKLQSELGEDVVVKYFHGGIIPNTADEENIGRKMSLEERREVQELMENRQAREQGKKYVFVASDIAQLGLNPDVNEVIVAGDYLAFGDLLQKGARIRPRRDEQGNILPNVIAGNFSMLVNPKRIIDIGNRLQLQAQDQNILQTVFTEIYRKIQEEFENLDPNWQVAGEQMENIASQVIDDFNRARREVNPNATTISRFAAGAMLRAMRESGLLSMQLVSEPVSEEQQEQLRQMAERGFIEPGSEPPKHLAFHLENVTNPIEHAQNSNIYVNPSNPNETISFVEYLSKLVEGRGREIKATGELLRNILISKSDENREVMWQNAERAFFSGDVQGLEDYVYQQMPRELAKEYVDEVRKSIRTFQENTENLSDLTESFARLKKEIDDLTEHYAQAGSEFKNAAITQLSEVLQSDLGSENLSRIAGLGEIASISVGNEGLTLMSTGGQFADLPISRPEATAGIGGAFYALGRVSSLGTADFERLRFASTGGGGGGGFGGFGGGWGGGRGGDYIPRRGGFWSAGLGPLVYAPYLLNRFARMLIAPIVAEGESYGELATSYLGLQYQSTSPSFLHQFAGRMEATAIRRGAALYPAIEPFDRIKEWASRRPGLVIAGSSLNVGAEALAGMFIATQSVSFFGGQVADVLFKNAAEIAQTQLNRGLITEQALKSMTREELVSRYLGPSAATAFSLMSGLAVKIAPLMLTWGLPIAATVAAGWGLYAASQYQEQQFLNSFQVYEKGTGRVLTQDELKERLGSFTYAQLVNTQGGVRRSAKGFAMQPVQLPGDLAVRKTLVGDVAEYATKLAEQYGYFQKGGSDAVANALYFLTSETGRKVGDKGIESALAEILPRALLEGRDPLKITEEAFGYAEFFAPKGTNEFFYHMAQFAKMSPRERSAQMRMLGIYGSRASAFQDLFGTEGEFLRFAQQMRFSASGEQIAQQVRRIYEMYAPQNQPFAANAPSTLDIGYLNQQALQYLAGETSPLSPYTAGIAVSLAGQYMQAGLLSPEHYPIASAFFGKFLSQFNLQQQSLIEQIVGGDMRAYSYAFWYQPDILESLGLTVTPFAQATYQSTTAEEIGEKLSRRTLPPPKRHPADKPAIRDIDAIRTPPPSRGMELLQPPFRFAAGYSSDVGIGTEVTKRRIASSPLVSSDVGVRAFMLEPEPGTELRNMQNWQESFWRKEQEPATPPFGEFVEKRTIKGRKTYPEGGASIIVAGGAEAETTQQPMSVNAMSRLLYDMYGRPVYQGVTGYQWGQILTQMSMAGMPVPAQYAGGFPTLQAFKQAYGFRSDFAARAFYTMPADQAQLMINERVRDLYSQNASLQLGSIGLAYSHAVQTFAITDQMRELQYKSRMADFATQRKRMSLSWGYQQAMLGIQEQRLQLQEWYVPASISLQERQMKLSWQQQDWMRQWGRDVELMQRQWAREAFSFSRAVSALQFSWKMEDYDEAIRSSHGRERRKLIRQKERETTLYNLEEEQAQKEMRQREELWKKEDERFEKEKEFIEEIRKLESESFELNKQYRLEMLALDREAFEAQKKYQEEMHQLDVREFDRKKREFQEMWELETQKYEADKQYQLASLGIQAQIAENQKEINELLGDQNTYMNKNEEVWGKIANYIELMNKYNPKEQLSLLTYLMQMIRDIPQSKIEGLIAMFAQITTISAIPSPYSYKPGPGSK